MYKKKAIITCVTRAVSLELIPDEGLFPLNVVRHSHHDIQSLVHLFSESFIRKSNILVVHESYPNSSINGQSVQL